MFEQYSQQLFVLAIFFTFVYSIVEVIRGLIPDKLEDKLSEKTGKQFNRWLSFIIAYGLAWTFDFKFASMIFKTINGSRATLHEHINYFIVASLLFVGAKWIHKKIKSIYSNFTNG